MFHTYAYEWLLEARHRSKTIFPQPSPSSPTPLPLLPLRLTEDLLLPLDLYNDSAALALDTFDCQVSHVQAGPRLQLGLGLPLTTPLPPTTTSTSMTKWKPS